MILLYVVCALGATWIAPYDPEAIDFAAMLCAPGAEHLFGTDQYGRDVFSRIVVRRAHGAGGRHPVVAVRLHAGRA